MTHAEQSVFMTSFIEFLNDLYKHHTLVKNKLHAEIGNKEELMTKQKRYERTYQRLDTVFKEIDPTFPGCLSMPHIELIAYVQSCKNTDITKITHQNTRSHL